MRIKKTDADADAAKDADAPSLSIFPLYDIKIIIMMIKSFEIVLTFSLSLPLSSHSLLTVSYTVYSWNHCQGLGTRHGTARNDTIRHVTAQHSTAQHGTARHGLKSFFVGRLYFQVYFFSYKFIPFLIRLLFLDEEKFRKKE